MRPHCLPPQPVRELVFTRMRPVWTPQEGVIGTVTMIHHAGCLVSMARQGSAFCGSPSMHGMSQKAEKLFKKA